MLLVLILLGLGIMLYPSISERLNRVHSAQVIQSFSEEIRDDPNVLRQMELALAYNDSLREGAVGTLSYEDVLDFGNGIMGYIEIPKISVKLPIYHGTGTHVLAKGVGHMEGTAFPVGGAGNHAVLTGHTGLPSAQLFTQLDQLQIGDLFYVTIGNRVIEYRVDQILVVLPQDGSELAAVPDMDYCTLLTCTPYGINSHRLLVRGVCTKISSAKGA